MAFQLLKNKKFLYLVILLSATAVGILLSEIFFKADIVQIFEPEVKSRELSIDFDFLEAIEEQGLVQPPIIKQIEVPGRLNPFEPY